MSSGIYQIRNLVNGKRYIGSSLNIERRWKHHLQCLKFSYSNKVLQKDWDLYGADAFVFEVLIYCEPDELLLKEQKRIDHYKTLSPNGYNRCPIAGSCAGVKHSEEYKRNLSEKLKGNTNGLNNKGKVISEETKLKMSIAASSRKISGMSGRKHSEESKLKMSFLKLGTSSKRKGSTLSEETKQKMRDSHKGHNLGMKYCKYPY
jgi:group I intron endonuclease